MQNLGGKQSVLWAIVKQSIDLNKQSLLLFLREGVLFVLIHLLFRSSITNHIWRTTDLLITHLLQVNRIPNKQKASLLSGKRGCFILKFSHNGRYNHRWNRESVLFFAQLLSLIFLRGLCVSGHVDQANFCPFVSDTSPKRFGPGVLGDAVKPKGLGNLVSIAF